MSFTTGVPYNPSNNTLFSPTQISGCALWLDAADSSTYTPSGNNLTSVKNKGLAAGNFTGSASINQIIQNNNTFFTFTAGSNKLSGSINLTSPYRSAFVIGKVGPSGKSYIFINTTGLLNSGPQFYSYFSLLSLELNRSGNNILVKNNAQGFFNTIGLFNATNNLNDIGLFINGTSLSPYTIDNTSIYTFSSGNTTLLIGDATGSSGTVHIGEVLIYDSVLTATQRQQVEGYLAWKWGLQANLPSSHPYYNNPYYPTVSSNAIIPLQLAPTLPGTVDSPLPVKSGLALWLDAADGSTVLLSGSNVTQWSDKSGNGRNAVQTIANYRPTYINNGISFTATSSNHFGFSPSPTYSQSHSIFLVAFNNGLYANGQYYFGRSSSNGSGPTIIQNYTGKSIEYYDSADRATFTSSPANTFMLSYTRELGGRIIGYYMGSQSFNIAQSVNANTSVDWSTVGNAYLTSFNSYINGVLYEFIIFNTVLTTTQRQQVEGYLAWKWGLQGSLPPNHPYASPSFTNIIIPRNIQPYVYSPRSFSGCALWLDAADSSTVIRTGNNITQWNDKSGNGRNCSVSGTLTYASNSIITTNGSLQTPSFVISSTSSISIFIVCNVTSRKPTGNADLIIGTPYSNLTLNRQGGSSSFSIYISSGTGSFSTTYTGLNSIQIYTLIYSPNTGTAYVTGTSYGSFTQAPGTGLTTSQVFNLFSNTNAYAYEVIVYNTALSTSQRQQIEGYLAWKYGIQKSLPSEHPFALFPP